MQRLNIQSDRLILRALILDDAPFILQLVNEPSWLRFIGDRQVRSVEDARRFIQTGPQQMYADEGLGLLLVASRDDARPMGLCGLLKRDWLQEPDLGFAFLPEFWGRGFAFESAKAVLDDATVRLGLERISAITVPDNEASKRLLTKLGFGLVAQIQRDGEALEQFGLDLA